jgi:hypothetical protein
MSYSALLTILAAAGISFAGPLTRDAQAFAHAIQSQTPDDLIDFTMEYPDSPFAPDALILAKAEGAGKGGGGSNKGGGNKGEGKGNTGPGNQGDSGNNNGKGNAGGSV